jgi:hypothetical protein
MAAFTVPQDTRSYAGDTEYFYEALRKWQERTGTFRTFDRLTPSQQSQIMRDSQELKRAEREPLTIDAVLNASRRSR